MVQGESLNVYGIEMLEVNVRWTPRNTYLHTFRQSRTQAIKRVVLFFLGEKFSSNVVKYLKISFNFDLVKKLVVTLQFYDIKKKIDSSFFINLTSVFFNTVCTNYVHNVFIDSYTVF